MKERDPRANIPSVESVLNEDGMKHLIDKVRRPYVVRWVQDSLRGLREEVRGTADGETMGREEMARLVVEAVSQRARDLQNCGIRRVINATGVLLHTNFGRAPVAKALLERMADEMSGYTDLEYSVQNRERGKRDAHVSEVLRQLLGCEDGTAVNNNAAAVFLVLHALAAEGEVVVSRGELVEIGGEFRIPDIIRSAGAKLREVGTTNRTRIGDYEEAVGPETRMLLFVHRSNFDFVGFSESPAFEQLVGLGRRAGVPVVADAGSGLLSAGAPGGRPGWRDQEPVVQHLLDAGADIACFSGDKLLGGPQAGVIAGRKAHLDRIRKDPVSRAVRLDKFKSFLLVETLKQYFYNEDHRDIPFLDMEKEPVGEVGKRCARIVSALKRKMKAGGLSTGDLSVSVGEGKSVIGGGTTPKWEIPSFHVVVSCPGDGAGRVERALREGVPPVIARIGEDGVRIDLRTVRAHEEEELSEALWSALEEELKRQEKKR